MNFFNERSHWFRLVPRCAPSVGQQLAVTESSFSHRTADDFGFAVDDEPVTEEDAAVPPSKLRFGPNLFGSRAARLARLAGVLVLLIGVTVLATTQIGASDLGARYRDYFNRLRGPATESQALGSQVARLLTVGSSAQLVSALSAAAQRQQLIASRIAEMTPPPSLRAEHRQAISALQLRASGLAGLVDVLRRVAAAPAAAAGSWSQLLAEQGRRLIAADVIWEDGFRTPTRTQLRRDRVSLEAPSSTFLSSPDEFTLSAMTTMLTGQRRLAGGLLGPGLSGPDVAAWQLELGRWLRVQPGQHALAITGVFDSVTTTATRVFQRAKQLGADGVVGPATRAALAASLRGG